MSPEERARQTRSLARWCPVMMSGIAEACMRTVGQAVKRRLFSWRTHLAREPLPYMQMVARAFMSWSPLHGHVLWTGWNGSFLPFP